MAVETKQGGKNTTTGNGPPNGAPNGRPSGTRKRPSSLMQVASSLPTVEHSLDEFIAKANQTTVDASTWKEAAQVAREEDEKRRTMDAMRWKAAEVQLREGDAREQSLRRQLDGLQGQLAEAEARAAVAGTAVGSAAHDAILADLRSKIDSAEQRMKAAESRNKELQGELEQAKDAAMHASGPVAVEFEGARTDSKVSPIYAAPAPTSARTLFLTFLAGGVVLAVIAIIVAKLFLVPSTPPAPAPAAAPAPSAAPASAAAVQPAAAPVPQPAAGAAPAAAPGGPSVTPIDDPAAQPTPTPTPTPTEAGGGGGGGKAAATPTEPAPSPADLKKAEAEAKKAEAAEAKKTAADAKAAKAAEAAEAKKAALEAKKAEAAAKKADAASKKKDASAKKANGGIADPFGGETAPAPKKKDKPKAEPKADKPSGGIVDPF